MQPTRTHHLTGGSDHTTDPETNLEIKTGEHSPKAETAEKKDNTYDDSKTIHSYTATSPDIM
jgi:hypothetical protein